MSKLNHKKNKISAIKIKGKPITLLVHRTKTWSPSTNIIYVSLKPNYMITSISEFLEKLASQAIIDALGE